jgi:hypothetical protein
LACRPLYSRCAPPSLKYTTVDVGKNERAQVNIIDTDGMVLYVETSLVAQPTCRSVFDEILHPRKHVFWRRYPIQGISESRIHLLLHTAGLTESANKIVFNHPGSLVPCYQHGNKQMIQMLSVSMNHFPHASELIDNVSAFFGVDRYFWTCGCHIVLFRNGHDKIGRHADHTQGETDIFTVVLQCDHDHVVHFTPMKGEQHLPSFQLYLHTGDCYYMNGELQKRYEHWVSRTPGVTESHVVMVFRRGNHIIADRDFGFPVLDFEFPVTWHYCMDDRLGLLKGKEYHFRELFDLKCFRYILVLRQFCIRMQLSHNSFVLQKCRAGTVRQPK